MSSHVMRQTRTKRVMHASAPTASAWIPPMIKGTGAIAPVGMKATRIFRMDAKVLISLQISMSI